MGSEAAAADRLRRVGAALDGIGMPWRFTLFALSGSLTRSPGCAVHARYRRRALQAFVTVVALGILTTGLFLGGGLQQDGRGAEMFGTVPR